jgi:hexosaminidase
MNRVSVAVFVLVAVSGSVVIASDGEQQALDLMPIPASLELGTSVLAINEAFTVVVEGEGATPRLERGVERMLRRLSDRTTLFFDNATFLDLTGHENPVMVIRTEQPGKIELGEDESYRLMVTGDGILLDAMTDIGALRGLETLLQLVVLNGNGVSLPEVSITDEPRFPWRGLMIDSSRHFMPVEMIRRNLDGMAAVKLNVLHWHLVDDQGFRVESEALPRLHELGSDGLYYTRVQIREIIDYAADRGIRVVPEFDLPGHGSAWLTAFPELASAPGPYEIERSWGIFDPTVNPTIEATYTFLDTFLAEMTALFDDEFIHIGGDENNGKHWLANPDIVAFMEANGYEEPLELQRYFNERVLEILTKYGKRMIGWDEIFQDGLPKNIVIQSWRGRESLFEAARLGYSGILSNGYYIDLIHPTNHHYLNDPLPADAPVAAEEAARILGGEATMWAEFVSPETVDSRIWPRTAAIAERFWSPGSVRDLEDMYRRLDIMSLRLEELGLLHERNRPMMLRRLCQCRDTAALEVLLETIEPVKVYNRGRLRKHTQFSPLTRMVDVAWPDAGPAREFRWTVDRLVAADAASPEDIDAVRAVLESWRDNQTALAPTIESSPALTEMAPMSSTLTEVATIGLEALGAAATKKTVTREWFDDRLGRLEAARLPHGQTELAIVNPVVSLVCAAAGPLADGASECRLNEDRPATSGH